MKKLVLSTTFVLLSIAALSQSAVDTTGIYGERKDSLNASVLTSSGPGNFLSKGKDIRTEVITAAGLCKMAFCNLAESFENSASVTVGYSDAVTRARQIRLLGQSGIYTQMLDENRPVMRGLSSPFGLNYIPSQWLESIQIAKGVTSVINGVESMTGQINMEHRKPTDEKPLFVQGSVMNDTKADLNVVSSLQLDAEGKWSTVILAHADGNFIDMDHNGDGFQDDPRTKQFSIANRWLYYGSDGTQVRFGITALTDRRNGGQMSSIDNAWRSNIIGDNAGAYLKVGVPLNEDNSSNVALVADYTWQRLDADYGSIGTFAAPLASHRYFAGQQSAFVNLLYQNQSNERHHFTLGLSETLDIIDESYNPGTSIFTSVSGKKRTTLSDLGAFGEYTFHNEDVFSAIIGLRGDWYNREGVRVSPRVTLKWKPSDAWVFRANGGRGLRRSNPVSDNIGILSTAKTVSGITYNDGAFIHPLEDSWTFGVNATWYLPFDKSGKTYLSLDYFHTEFIKQLLVDHQEVICGPGIKEDAIMLYELGDILGSNYSRTGNIQLDFSTEPVKGLTLTLTGRLTDARQTLKGQSDDIKPMTSLYKGVLNVQYATNLNKWIFDLTASVNGPCRVWDFMKSQNPSYEDGYTEVYPLLYAQVTKRFKGFDIYLGGENLTGYRQSDPIIGVKDNRLTSAFDASCVWGPLMGTRIYAGFRVTIWKK